VKIEVTAADIRKARRLQRKGEESLAEICPIALAARRAFGGEAWVSGVINVISSRIFSMPEEAHQFIRDFDNGFKVLPFEFECKLTPLIARGK
jgi:hypothetical protein